MSKHKSNKQLTDLDRLQIKVFLNQGYSPAEMAAILPESEKRFYDSVLGWKDPEESALAVFTIWIAQCTICAPL